MKRTTLRTSAIALGVAAAMPATGQEWNLQWGGFMNQHFVFGSTEQKHTTSKMGDVSYTIEGDHDGRGDDDGYKITVKFIGEDDVPTALQGRELDDDASGINIQAESTARAGEVGSVYINPTPEILRPDPDASPARSQGTLIDALEGTAPTGATIKKIYINSAVITDAGTPTAARYNSITIADIAGMVDIFKDRGFILGDNQDLDGLEVYIVDTEIDVDDVNALEGGEGALAFDGNKIALTNAYGQVSEAVGKANTTVDLSGSSQRRNTEVHFKPSITLENGITFGAAIEFEGDAGGVDRSNMMISSDSFGKITLGAHPSMGYGMMVAAPGVGLAINSGGHIHFIPVSAEGAAYSTSNEVGGNWEPMRVSYQSPSLGGLTLGLSYAADGKGNGNSANNSGYLKAAEGDGDLSDIIDLGVKFSQSLGETSFTVAARYGTAEKEGAEKKPREAAVGAQVGFGAVTDGAAYADSERGDKSSSGWSLGASFKPNEAWTLGIETYQGEYDNGDDHSASKIAASRNLGPGVAWDLYAITSESTSTSSGLSVTQGSKTYNLNSVNKTEASGTIFGTAIKLSF